MEFDLASLDYFFYHTPVFIWSSPPRKSGETERVLLWKLNKTDEMSLKGRHTVNQLICWYVLKGGQIIKSIIFPFIMEAILKFLTYFFPLWKKVWTFSQCFLCEPTDHDPPSALPRFRFTQPPGISEWWLAITFGSHAVSRWGCNSLKIETPIFPALPKQLSRLWFQIIFIFNPTWGNDPIWLIFFKGVETTN